MNLEEFYKLSNNEQDVLVAKYGLTRMGNRIVKEEEMVKIPVPKKPEELKEPISDETLGEVKEVKKRGRKKKE